MMERESEKGLDGDDEQETLLGIKLREGLAAGKKAGPCTPSPAWKLEEAAVDLPRVSVVGGEGRQAAAASASRSRQSVSARKLCANLWELQDLLPAPEMSRRSRKPRRRVDGGGCDGDGGDLFPIGLSDRRTGALGKHVADSLIQFHRSNERKSHALQPLSPAAYSSSMEVTPYNPAFSSGGSSDLQMKIGKAGCSLKTSTELLKVLNRIWSLEEQNASNETLVNALKSELEHSRARLHELTQEKKAHQHEMDDLLNQVAEEKLTQKVKEQDKIKAAVQSIREELDGERRLRRRSESLHHKLGKELSETKAMLSKAFQNLDIKSESIGLLECLCDEFAKGICEYEKEMRDLKQRYPKDCMWKFDSSVLHISEAWLDERLQIDKVSIVDRMKDEIISFIQARQANIIDSGEQHHDHKLRRQSLESLHLNGTLSAPRDIEDDDSIASDLHCFELNMDKTKKMIPYRMTQHGEIYSTIDADHGEVSAIDKPKSSTFSGRSADLEITECSAKLPQGLKENTLKAKLLEARLEGRHARLKALKGLPVGASGQ
ncbi:Uncharacterized protein AXF42_Ash014936 [Apostasia shenzhenica]|uniref:Uncharacterized protein n=1 Tax=Apostasia shenzhenica TaxID=1088818 RepID=A0A2I0ALK5_9ASPA|nr:Uncharacterized protein AXF42_Ash014936 [Apostasia shenzhenica]